MLHFVSAFEAAHLLTTLSFLDFNMPVKWGKHFFILDSVLQLFICQYFLSKHLENINLTLLALNTLLTCSVLQGRNLFICFDGQNCIAFNRFFLRLSHGDAGNNAVQRH